MGGGLGRDRQSQPAEDLVAGWAIVAAHGSPPGARHARWIGACLLAALAFALASAGMPCVAPLGAVIAIWLWVGACSLPLAVRAGTDGLLVWGLGLRRFVPYHDVELTVSWWQPRGANLVVTFLQDRRLSLRLGSQPVLTQTRARRNERLLDRIEARAQAASRSVPPAAELSNLRRGRHSVDEWLVSLVKLGLEAREPYRCIPNRRAQLWRMVLDVRGEVELRAAAAVAVGPCLRDSERAELEQVARVTANPALRRVFRAVCGRREDLPRAMRALG